VSYGAHKIKVLGEPLIQLAEKELLLPQTQGPSVLLARLPIHAKAGVNGNPKRELAYEPRDDEFDLK
jgi:hypothetical protein